MTRKKNEFVFEDDSPEEVEETVVEQSENTPVVKRKGYNLNGQPRKKMEVSQKRKDALARARASKLEKLKQKREVDMEIRIRDKIKKEREEKKKKKKVVVVDSSSSEEDASEEEVVVVKKNKKKRVQPRGTQRCSPQTRDRPMSLLEMRYARMMS